MILLSTNLAHNWGFLTPYELHKSSWIEYNVYRSSLAISTYHKYTSSPGSAYAGTFFGFWVFSLCWNLPYDLSWITKINNKLKFKNFVFQFRTRDYVPHATKSRKLFNINFKIVCLWKKILGFLSLWKEFYSSFNELCFSWYFTYKTKDTCCMSEKRFLKWVFFALSLI